MLAARGVMGEIEAGPGLDPARNPQSISTLTQRTLARRVRHGSGAGSFSPRERPAHSPPKWKRGAQSQSEWTSSVPHDRCVIDTLERVRFPSCASPCELLTLTYGTGEGTAVWSLAVIALQSSIPCMSREPCGTPDAKRSPWRRDKCAQGG